MYLKLRHDLPRDGRIAGEDIRVVYFFKAIPEKQRAPSGKCTVILAFYYFDKLNLKDNQTHV